MYCKQPSSLMGRSHQSRVFHRQPPSALVPYLFASPRSPGRWAKYCDQRVCLSVCSHISKTTRPNFTKFSVHVTYGSGSVLLGLWMTLCSHIMEPMGQNQARHYVSTSSPDGGTGGKDAVYDCSLCPSPMHILIICQNIIIPLSKSVTLKRCIRNKVSP